MKNLSLQTVNYSSDGWSKGARTVLLFERNIFIATRNFLRAISRVAKIRHIILQNEALDVNYSKKLVSRSTKVIKGQKSLKKDQKGQISIFFKSKQIIRQNGVHGHNKNKFTVILKINFGTKQISITRILRMAIRSNWIFNDI